MKRMKLFVLAFAIAILIPVSASAAVKDSMKVDKLAAASPLKSEQIYAPNDEQGSLFVRKLKPEEKQNVAWCIAYVLDNVLYKVCW